MNEPNELIIETSKLTARGIIPQKKNLNDIELNWILKYCKNEWMNVWMKDLLLTFNIAQLYTQLTHKNIYIYRKVLKIQTNKLQAFSF